MPDGLLSLANCQTVSYPVYIQKTGRKNPTITEERCQFDSAAEALQAVLQQETPDIIAVGETHPRKSSNDKPTTLIFFTENLLPVLAQKGYLDLVLEGLVSDRESDQAVTSYLAGKLPILKLEANYFFPLGNVNNFGTKQFLEAARRLKARIYGGGPLLHDPENFDIYYNTVFALGKPNSDRLPRKISRRTTDKILQLFKRGLSKVVIYSGAMHNDLTGRAQKNGLNYGAYFKERTPYKYVEFDILTPELMDKGHFRNYTYKEYETWLKSAVPDKGATLIKRGQGSYTLMLPKGVLAP